MEKKIKRINVLTPNWMPSWRSHLWNIYPEEAAKLKEPYSAQVVLEELEDHVYGFQLRATLRNL